MKHRVVGTVHLVPSIDISTDKERVVSLPQKGRLVRTCMTPKNPCGVHVVRIWWLPAHVFWRYQQLIKILFHRDNWRQVVEDLEWWLPEGLRVVLEVELNSDAPGERGALFIASGGDNWGINTQVRTNLQSFIQTPAPYKYHASYCIIHLTRYDIYQYHSSYRYTGIQSTSSTSYCCRLRRYTRTSYILRVAYPRTPVTFYHRYIVYRELNV